MNDKPKNPAAVALGRLGGRAGRGPSKARTTEQARAAVAVRWAKRNQEIVAKAMAKLEKQVEIEEQEKLQ